MKRMLRYAAWGLLLSLGLVMALYAHARLRGPSPEQQAALSTLQRVPPTGRNAFAALWLLAYEVPGAEVDAVMDADRRAFAALEDSRDRMTFESVAHVRYRKWELDSADRALLCQEQADCTTRIAADPETYRRLVARHAVLIARVRGLLAQDFDYSRSAWPTGEVLPTYVPLTQGTRLALVEDQLAFAAGRRADATGHVCAMASGVRRLMRSPENLIDSMIFDVVARDLAQSYAWMLAAMPAEESPPPGCAQAFAPATIQEQSLCEPMRGEFVFMTHLLLADLEVEGASVGAGWLAPLKPVLFDLDNTQAQRAVQLAHPCSPNVERQLAQDLPVTWSLPTPSPWRLECVGNAVGCWAMDMGGPVDEGYQHRLQDFAARIRLVGALQWLRAHPEDPRPLQQRLRDMPPSLLSAQRPVEPADDGRSLRVRMYAFERNGDYWTIPLGR